MDDSFPVNAQAMQELLARLIDRRTSVEKELGALGDQRKGGQDIFRHCRGFERAFQVMLNEANVAFKIRAVVEGTLPETLRRIPIEKRFNKNYTREICREADGYQPHLVSPERGIKRLVAEAMKLTNEHVHRFVDEIHMVLIETVRESARRSVLVESGIIIAPGAAPGRDMDFLRLKGFENAVIVAAQQALEEWRAEAHRVAEIMVQMECDYVTPSFFRDLEKRFQEQHAVEGDGDDRLAALAAGQVSPREDDEDSDSESAADSTSSPPGPGARASSGALGPAAPAMPQRADLKSGWLDKRAGESSNLASLAVEKWRWQRRWFVLAMESGILYYFSNPNTNVAPRVKINMRECIVEDFHPENAGIPANRRSTQKLDGNAGSVSLLIRLSHRNPGQPLAKDHAEIILRAADASDKFDWLARLRNATEAAGGAARGPRIAGSSAQYTPAAASAPGGGEQKGLFGRGVAKVTGQLQKLGLGTSKLGDVMELGSIEDLDVYYERLGWFCGLYARAAYDRMSKTVPKAIILCQVIRSRDRLLDQLFNYISSLSPKEVEFMLQEDPTVGRRRAAAQQAVKDLADAIEEVRKAQERRAEAAPGAKRDAEQVSVRALLLAGAFPLVPKDRVPPGVNPALMYGEHTPMALAPVPGEQPPQLGPPAGPRAAAAAGAENGGAQPAAAAAVNAAPAPAGSAAAKPRRQPPPPPPSS